MSLYLERTSEYKYYYLYTFYNPSHNHLSKKTLYIYSKIVSVSGDLDFNIATHISPLTIFPDLFILRFSYHPKPTTIHQFTRIIHNLEVIKVFVLQDLRFFFFLWHILLRSVQARKIPRM